jgi:hypothetical protein
MLRVEYTQVRGTACGTVLARPFGMEHVLHDEAETQPILMAPLVTIATTLALVLFTALLGH